MYYMTDPKLNECLNLISFLENFSARKIKNFGNSDCKNKCGSHLIFIQKMNVTFFDLDKHLETNNWHNLDI